MEEKEKRTEVDHELACAPALIAGQCHNAAQVAVHLRLFLLNKDKQLERSTIEIHLREITQYIVVDNIDAQPSSCARLRFAEDVENKLVDIQIGSFALNVHLTQQTQVLAVRLQVVINA